MSVRRPSNSVTLCVAGLVTAVGSVGAMSPGWQLVQDPPPPADAFHRSDRTIASGEVDFNKDIRPILATNCFLCHGFDASTRKADLRLDIRAGAIAATRGRAPAISPGHADESVLVERISSDDPFFHMPPGNRTQLTSDEVELIRRWIDQGARYDRHWSFKPLTDPEPPDVRANEWPRDPIDRFILATLEANDLAPAPEADRHTLIRRLTFDLTGLPPAPEEVDAFVHDRSPDAYERVVDRLLESPHFGERWGRHWLDLVRYAETHGHEFDYPIHHAWQYRDYVIRALNEDVPYDAFVREHVAGDLLDKPRLHSTEKFNESVIGTGWWWLSQGTHGPVDVRLDEAERIDNQIDVLSKTFLGLTVSCARCHDHKFDSITQRDYYGLSGFVQSSRRQVAYLDPRGEIKTRTQELEALQQQIDTQFATAIPQLDTHEVRRFLDAASDVLHGTPGPTDDANDDLVVVFDDFEDGNYDGWTVDGTAFGSHPYSQDTLAGYQGDVGAHGTRFINSHNSRSGEDVRQADEHTGSMSSGSFVIEHGYIHFLIGGGAHAGKTCINLIVGDEVKRTAHGTNSNRMRREVWDVREFRDREARFQILDNEQGGWGNIGVDHIVFSNEPRLLEGITRPIGVVARERNLDEDALRAWVRAITDPARPVALDSPDRKSEDEVFEDFEDDWSHEWFLTGHAFGNASTRAGQRIAHTMVPVEPGVAHSGLVGTRIQGTLRSRTFELTSPFIHYRVKGHRAVIRLIVDGYWLDEFNALLFDGMKFDVNVDDEAGWKTHTHRILDKYIGHRAHIEIIDDGDGWIAVDDIILSKSSAPPPGRGLPGLTAESIALSVADFASGQADRDDVEHVRWLLANDVLVPAKRTELETLLARSRDLDASIPAPMRALALTDGTPEDERIFVRGNHTNPGEIAPRGMIDDIAPGQSPVRHGSGRLELAERMLDASNPLPARVAVNRVWLHLFGVGLVPTPDDFGALGQPPTHPRLLDSLAHWFRTDGGWSMKALIRRIVLSSTYRMSSDPADTLAESIDPTNAMYHRQNVKRLEGEAIRDALLAVSGRLDLTMFGPPVPLHLTAFMQGRGRPGRSGPLDGDGRRSIYLEVRRNFLSPMMLAFDAPVPHSTVGARNSSNVPAQALILMNDPLVGEQARRFAGRLLDHGPITPVDRINRAYREALGRDATDREHRAAISFLQRQAEIGGLEDGGWRDHEPGWADFCHAVFNLKEFIFIE